MLAVLDQLLSETMTVSQSSLEVRMVDCTVNRRRVSGSLAVALIMSSIKCPEHTILQIYAKYNINIIYINIKFFCIFSFEFLAFLAFLAFCDSFLHIFA